MYKKPVSSLRSHFESIAKSKPAPRVPPAIPPRPGTTHAGRQRDEPGPPQPRGMGRMSLDSPRPGASHGAIQHSTVNMGAVAESDSRPETPRTRPLSMGPASPTRAHPTVTVESPKSPPKYFNDMPNIQSLRSRSPAIEQRKAPSSQSHGPLQPAPRSFKIPSRTGTPSLESQATPILGASSVSNISPDPRKIDFPSHANSSNSSSLPPPINRAVKPKAFNTPQVRKASETLAAPVATSDVDADKISPFSTPPSEPESPPLFESPPPIISDFSKPRTVPSNVRDNHFNRPSSRTPSYEMTPPPRPPRRAAEEQSDRLDPPPPVLPPRNKSPRPPPPPPPEPRVRRSFDTQPTSARSRSSLDNQSRMQRPAEARNLIPPRRAPAQNEHPPPVSHFPPPPRPPRTSVDHIRDHQISDRHSLHTDSDEFEENEQSPDRQFPSRTDFPDSSHANRRPPRFKSAYEIPVKTETKLLAVCGDIVCTGGYITKAWNVLTGDLLMSITHGETVKATAIAFKPGESEGQRIWIGTNTGEIHEIDIPSQSVVDSSINAHSRCNIIKIHRHGSNMWSLDEEGKLLSWPLDDETGFPTLSISPSGTRVPPKPTFCLVLGSQLWIAMGKGIWVYEPNMKERTARQITPNPLTQPNVGEVTSGTTLTGKTDKVYFGHNDGKVTIYSRADFSCLAVIAISLYKINALVGVGDLLWAGFSTGMIYVYDMSTQPWKVRKDWKAHDHSISSIQVDGSSVWKMDRLQVVSLGTDMSIRIWDGLLTEDWLDADLVEHETEYCNFNEITVSVMTWNAGASKPSKLRQDEQDENFFREYLTSSEPADIVIFGFQELVDLEDKKVTAKSLFKSSKKRDAQDQEKMSHQYRAWRDYLARCIDENIGPSTSYQLLHTATLVGLFTCVFIKDSVRGRLSCLSSAQIKLGMGGLHGNKGALIVRFLIDDSSLCFLNCHLAAGQRHTTHRNNDVAAIMEATALPMERDPYRLTTSYAGIGGDGTMVLDHDVCVLNGDLNYRIDSIPRGSIIGSIVARNYAKLLDCDQLLLSRARNPSFRLRAFLELPITFAPTYKFDVGTDNYDSSEKQRAPAWCDRVLFRGRGVKAERYRSWERPKTSDHRPVTLNLKIRVRSIRSEAELQRCRDDGRKRLQQWSQRVGMEIK
jgi:endonuclease/exonuclease/phosphatase family protein